MTDQPSDNPANESTPGALLPTAIDEALSQASGLAGDLLKELGTAEEASAPARAESPALEDKSTAGEAVDVQLSHIQQDLAVTRSELAGTPDEDAPDTGSMDYKAAAEAFGATTGGSAEDEDPGSAADRPEPTSAESLGQEHGPESGKLPGGKVIKLAKRPSEPADPGDSVPGVPDAISSFENQVADEPSREGHTEPNREPVPDPASRGSDRDETSFLPARRKAPGATAMGWMGTLLDVVNLPFGRVGEQARRLIGWFALALLVPALILFAISFLW